MNKVSMTWLLAILCVIPTTFAQETTKTYCLSAIEYTGSADSLKAELLTAAKREAVREFFGEFISSFTKVENLRITADTIQATSLGFVRIKGDPEYYQGKNFGEVCVKIVVYATEEDFAQFQPQTLRQKSCITEGDVKTIKEETEKKAIWDALINYDRRLEAYPPEQVLPLLREVSFIDEGFVPETEIYCAKASGVMYPIEVMGALVEPTPESVSVSETEETPTAGPQKSEYTLDLTKYEVGDLPEELGRNLIVGETEQGKKYIFALTPDPPGEIEINDLFLSESFEVNIYGYLCRSQIIVSGPLESITITYENQDDVALRELRKDPRVNSHCQGCCYDNADLKLVVKGEKATLFIANKLFGTIFVKPDVVYKTLFVKGLGDKDKIYSISVRDL